MAATLGILVNSDRHLDHLIGLARAARKKGVRLIVFFTHRGVLLTRDERFSELDGLAEMSLCRKSFLEYHLEKNGPVPGIPPAHFLNQFAHADLIERSDRYIVL